MRPELPLSVVLPLADHRGLAVQSTREWAHQTLSADCYEIVVVDGGGDPRLGAEVKRSLRDRDRFVSLPGRSEIELYEAGARAAAGATLLFTESHCVPERDAAEALLRHLHDTGAGAATLGSGYLARGRLAALEAALDGRHLEGCAPERWWAVASLRGLAVRRRVFLDVGGFRTRLERFAETVLAVELERRGCRATRAAAARVHHGDCSSPRELENALLSLGRGRARLLVEGIPAHLEPWLGGLDGVSRADVDREIARSLCRTALAVLLATPPAPGPGLRGAALDVLRTLGPVALAGARGAVVAARVRARLALWRCALGLEPGPRRLRVYERAWRTAVQCGQMEVQAQRSLPSLLEAEPPLELFPGEMEPDSLVGFHGRERDGNGTFRWSGPFGLVRVALPRGPYQVAAHVMRPPGEGDPAVLWNGERLALDPDGPVAGGERVRARVVAPEGGEQHLVVLAPAFAPRDAGRDDERTLGVAVRRLSFTPC